MAQKKKNYISSKENLSLYQKLEPKTEAQRQMIYAYKEGFHIVAHGSAGTGKSYLACSLALDDLFEGKVGKIVIVRSAVETRAQGFLPGSIEEKYDPYTVPYKQIINQLTNNGNVSGLPGKTAWDILSKKGYLEFITTSFIRGITLENCIVIVDEFQNCDSAELESILTRVGENCQLIICGDSRQGDLQRKREKSGFDWLMRVTENMTEWFDSVHFYPKDIVRSGFVKELIMTIEDLE